MLANNLQLQFATSSLFPIMFSINLMFGLLLIGLFFKENNKAVKYWIYGSLLFSLGMLIIWIRPGLPFFLGYVLANFFVTIFHCLCFRGIEYFNTGKSPKYYFIEICCSLYALGFLVLKWKYEPSVIAIYAGIFSSVLHLWIFFRLFYYQNSHDLRYSKLIAFCFLGGGLVWALRTVLANAYSFGESTAPGFYNWLTLLLLLLLIILRDFFFLALLLTKSNQELTNVNQLLLEKEQLLKELSEEKFKSERANQAKSQFLANVSHEIRTPIHGLIGLVSMVLKSSMSEEIRKSLDKVLFSSNDLALVKHTS